MSHAEVTPACNTTRTSVSWLVDLAAMGSIQPGQQLQVKIDPLDPRIYPGGEWAACLLQ